MYVTRGMEGGHPKCVQVRAGGEGYHASCVRTHLNYLFMFLSNGVSFYLQKFNLTFIQKGCVCQKWLFFSNEINFCCNEISFLYFKLFFRTKVSQKAFNFNRMMMMNCFCGMVDRRKVFTPFSSRDHYQRFSPSQISDTPRAGFEIAQNLSSDFVE